MKRRREEIRKAGSGNRAIYHCLWLPGKGRAALVVIREDCSFPGGRRQSPKRHKSQRDRFKDWDCCQRILLLDQVVFTDESRQPTEDDGIRHGDLSQHVLVHHLNVLRAFLDFGEVLHGELANRRQEEGFPAGAQRRLEEGIRLLPKMAGFVEGHHIEGGVREGVGEDADVVLLLIGQEAAEQPGEGHVSALSACLLLVSFALVRHQVGTLPVEADAQLGAGAEEHLHVDRRPVATELHSADVR